MRLSDSIEEALSVLHRGGVIVYPTDTLLGFGANALDRAAVDRVFRIKSRPTSQPIAIAVSSIDQAKEYAYINPKQEAIINAVWPGSVTVVLRAKSVLPDNLSAGNNTIAMRIPDHPIPQQLTQEFPITGTSANLTGQEPCRFIHEVQSQFYGRHPQPDLLLDMPAQNKSGPSTVVDITTPESPKILRVGATTPARLLELLRP